MQELLNIRVLDIKNHQCYNHLKWQVIVTDWNKAKNEYITTNISCRKIAEKYGCSPSAVLKRSNAEGWVQSRNQFNIKTASKTAEKCSETIADSSCALYQCADLLIEKLTEAVTELDAGDVVGIHHCTKALKDLVSVFGIKSELDIKEQELKIKLLQHQLDSTSYENKEIKVVLSGELERYAM